MASTDQIINTLSFRQKSYIKLCHLLGVKYFKKYWVVQGSFWNKTHLDKNSVIDLEEVINDSWNYSKHHIGILFLELLTYFVGSFSGLVTMQQFKGYIPIGILLHVYPLLVHHYNRILAAARITFLSLKNPPEEKKDLFIKCNDLKYLKIRRWSKTQPWQIYYKNAVGEVGPLFLASSDAIHFAEWIEKNYKEQEFLFMLHEEPKLFYTRYKKEQL